MFSFGHSKSKVHVRHVSGRPSGPLDAQVWNRDRSGDHSREWSIGLNKASMSARRSYSPELGFPTSRAWESEEHPAKQVRSEGEREPRGRRRTKRERRLNWYKKKGVTHPLKLPRVGVSVSPSPITGQQRADFQSSQKEHVQWTSEDTSLS